jgi:cytochrome c biogenesis protein CcmG/thiol:disulfide interchange protein DsbE
VKRTDQILIGLIVAMAVALIWIVAGTLKQPLITAGDTAPNFTVVTDQGNTISPSRFQGKLLVLNFWATWCAGCIQEITSLDAFQKSFASQGVVVVGVSMDTNEERYKQFLRRFPVSFVTKRDPTWDISASYGTFQLPETYIINRSGRVVEKIIAAYNFMDPDFLVRIQRALK